MNLIKSIERIKQMDDLICRKATGTPEEFAEKLALSRAMLMISLREMKELGAEIGYCRHRKSYFYERDFDLWIGGPRNRDGGIGSVRGGGIFYGDDRALANQNIFLNDQHSLMALDGRELGLT